MLLKLRVFGVDNYIMYLYLEDCKGMACMLRPDMLVTPSALRHSSVSSVTVCMMFVLRPSMRAESCSHYDATFSHTRRPDVTNPLCAAYSNLRKNFGKFKLPLVANVYWGYNDRTRGQILENSACVIKIIAY